MLEIDTDNAVIQYQQALQKLKQLAAQKDFTSEGDEAYVKQFNEVKRLYLEACPPNCEVSLEVVHKSNITLIDDRWEYTPPPKSDNRLQIECSFAYYVAGCLAHADCLNFGGSNTEESFLNAARIIAACLHQMPRDDAPELPFEW